MIVQPDAPLLTVAEYKNLPETGPRYQLIEGDLCRAPAPSRFHQDISRNLQGALDRYLETNPIGILYDAPFDVYLTNIDVFQPDLLVVLDSNRSILTDAGAGDRLMLSSKSFRRRLGSSIWSIRSASTRDSESRNSGSSILKPALSLLTDLRRARKTRSISGPTLTRRLLLCCLSALLVGSRPLQGASLWVDGSHG